jgi:sugar lactone lactonase YvrE
MRAMSTAIASIAGSAAERPVPADPSIGLCAAQGRDVLGECPLWDDERHLLWWVDIRTPALCLLDPARGTTTRWRLPDLVGSIALTDEGSPASPGRLVVALGHEIALFDPAAALPSSSAQTSEGSPPEPMSGSAHDELLYGDAGPGLRTLCEVPLDHPDHRFNDGRCDPAGRFWVGTMNNLTRGPEGRMFRLEARRGLVEFPSMAPGLRIPNSLAFSPDGRTMYFADSLDHAIRAFEYDPSSGLPGASRPFAHCTPPAFPDGACVDTEGGVWSARFHGGCIVRHDPDGRLSRVIELPVRRPTSCAFGGQDLSTLYVTTTCQQMSAVEREAEPLAGRLLALDVGCRGLPEPRFALHGLSISKASPHALD